jgi:fructuronate reductase
MTDDMRLSARMLERLPGDVDRPAFDRGGVTPGIVHLGVGAFHRAHQAVYTDDRIAAGETGWGIVGVSLRSPATRDALSPQDGLYTLALRDGGGEALRVVGSLVELLVAPEEPARLSARLDDARTRIVTLTITEKGYTADIAAGRLRADLPEVMADLADPAHPRTAVGQIVAALARRRAAGVAPFTVLSCDNLPGNGPLLHRVLIDYAAKIDPDLARHVENEVACPATMIDRIVPATTDADRAGIAARLGMRDAWPVIAEPFSEWIIEDRFPTGRPDWGSAGAVLVDDVAPWEMMKLRMLNGAHSTLAAMGRVCGRETVAEAMADPVIAGVVRRLWAEVAPTLSARLDPADYARRLDLRFANPALRHLTAQIATDASQKLPQRLLATLRDLRAAGRPVPVLTFALAAWMRSCAGVDEAGRAMTLNDPVLTGWADLPDPALPAEVLVRRMMSFAPVFGDLGQDAGLTAAVAAHLQAIRDGGIRAAALRIDGAGGMDRT